MRFNRRKLFALCVGLCLVKPKAFGYYRTFTLDLRDKLEPLRAEKQNILERRVTERGDHAKIDMIFNGRSVTTIETERKNVDRIEFIVPQWVVTTGFDYGKT